MPRSFFLISPTSRAFEHLPRETRMAVRAALIIPPTPRPAPIAHTGYDLDDVVNNTYNDPCGDTHYYNTNTVDHDFDLHGHAEFDDCTGDDLGGLTIVDPGEGNIRHWLKGHDIL